MSKRATIYKLSTNDDLNTIVRKLNRFMSGVSQDINVTNITQQGGSGTRLHHDLIDTDTEDCHPQHAIIGLEARLAQIETDITSINTKLRTIDTKITDIQDILDNHEERIKALEEE